MSLKRRVIAGTAAIAVAGGIAGVTLASCGGSASASPEEILHSDGYTTVLNLNASQFQQLGGQGTPDLAPYIVTGVVGANASGSHDEVVIQLTQNGVNLVKSHLSEFTSNSDFTSAHLTGNDLVLDN
jgi:hypothetical protein